MSEDWRLLIEAIEGLKQESSFLKDYLWPILTGLFSALLGAGIAFWTIKHQERVQIEKEKLDSVNSLMLTVLQAQANLLAWKNNYAQTINIDQSVSTDPLYRLLSIPRMVGVKNSIDYKTESIIFIAKNEQEVSEFSDWQNIARIFSMIGNYNELQTVLDKRSESYEKVVKIIAASQNGTDINRTELYQLIPWDLLKETIDLTEKMIVMVDDLIIEMTSFLQKFPDISKNSIKTKKIKHYGNVITASSPPDEFLYLYQRCMEVNYQKLAKIFHENEELVKVRYKRGQMTSED
ncbi:hypothetical protein GHNINEIG_01632 [Hydrogenovibrio crunogenus]|uniref:Uncharacterized protein n=1 Tax=Hydrogenovibrio crunogenus TaxID=39765 RepID=A0A4P7P2M7_9GAMM|nr:hypothetical protein [Hydrogenovibrio crunogenus]QBZ83572.1 hypothetical protein GHNINEIG_01632 [Hydrogenovibrio crunogenus]